MSFEKFKIFFLLFAHLFVPLHPIFNTKHKGKKNTMNGKELNDLFKGLKEQGWTPQLCDTPIPVSLALAASAYMLGIR